MSKWYQLPGVVLVIIATGYCFVSGTFSLLTPDQRGYRYFNEGRNEAAAGSFIDPMWRGAAYYRDAKFKEAAAVYSGFDTPEAVYNHGNTLVMLGKYEDAVKRYERALELHPGWNAAETNLEIARGRAEKLKKEGGEMTGGKLAADEYVFSENKSTPGKGEDDVSEGQAMSDSELRALWLRNVQTRPADFLRAKFSYQVAMQENNPDNQQAPETYSAEK